MKSREHLAAPGPARSDRPPRPRLGCRVVRGLEALLRAQDGNLLAVAEQKAAPGRRDYQRAVRYLERLVVWSRGRRGG
ncbi:MAG: hypothetical protein HUU06_10445 [Planctomycetaceae bacterium]|nr:hypothetical protein [Planctomycetota bacterium]NUN53188.1 hypothetical protein [Planctomycetaceae bacterium]